MQHTLLFGTWTESNFTSWEVRFTEWNLPINITRGDHRFRISSRAVTNFGGWKIGIRIETKSHLSPNYYPLYTFPARLFQEQVVLYLSQQSDHTVSTIKRRFLRFNNTEIRTIQFLSKEYEVLAVNVNTARAWNWLFTFIHCQSRECMMFYHYSPYPIMT